ncbi:MAG: carbohydrate-binding protein, partial [Bacteroidales bacterium]|nr:carbohydrate-binding protein [Bacteroidales bacterium]
PVVNGPFKGPHVLSAGKPCIIPMSDFDIGGEGVAFHETGEINQGGTDWYRFSGNDPFSIPVDIEAPGMSLSYIEAGEWVQYTVEVNDAGIYLCQLHASGMDDGKFHLEVDGENRTGSVDLPASGEWFRWKWQPATPLRLTFAAGTHHIRFYCEQPGYNVKAMKLTFLKK